VQTTNNCLKDKSGGQSLLRQNVLNDFHHFDFELGKIAQWRANTLSLIYNKPDFMLLNSPKHNPTSFKLLSIITAFRPYNLQCIDVRPDNILS